MTTKLVQYAILVLVLVNTATSCESSRLVSKIWENASTCKVYEDTP